MSVSEATGFFADIIAIILNVFRRNRNWKCKWKGNEWLINNKMAVSQSHDQFCRVTVNYKYAYDILSKF
jgi:hypothetical protein